MTTPQFPLEIDSRSLVSTEDPDTGSEFGGVGGIIQPPPHSPSASERLSMIYAIDPLDDGTRPDSVLAPELDGDFSSRGYR
jgi:hypothetical protein